MPQAVIPCAAARRGVLLGRLAALLRSRRPSPTPPAEPPLTASTEYIFYAGVALFLLRAWAFGFGKANREKLGLIMAYSLASMLLTAEVGPASCRATQRPRNAAYVLRLSSATRPCS